jgi:hypothetical protein
MEIVFALINRAFSGDPENGLCPPDPIR